MGGQRKPISSREGVQETRYRRVFSLATDTIGNRFACEKIFSKEKNDQREGRWLRAVNDAIFRSLPSSIFPFLLFSLSLPFFVFFNPRDSATVRVHDRSRSATKFFGFLRFRLDTPLPLGSLGEIDRKLFDIFALWRIRTGDNCAWNHISFPFPSTLPTQRSTFLARVYTLCVNYHDSRENVKQFLYWPPETRERNLFVHVWPRLEKRY